MATIDIRCGFCKLLFQHERSQGRPPHYCTGLCNRSARKMRRRKMKQRLLDAGASPATAARLSQARNVAEAYLEEIGAA